MSNAQEEVQQTNQRIARLSTSVMTARKAVALAKREDRPKPRGVSMEEAVKLAPGRGLSDAVLEERASRDY